MLFWIQNRKFLTHFVVDDRISHTDITWIFPQNTVGKKIDVGKRQMLKKRSQLWFLANVSTDFRLNISTIFEVHINQPLFIFWDLFFQLVWTKHKKKSIFTDKKTKLILDNYSEDSNTNKKRKLRINALSKCYPDQI